LYYSLLIATTLATGLILHAAASCLAYFAWRGWRTGLDRMQPRAASRLLFAIRVAPILVTWFMLVAFVIPSFLEFEPRATLEPLSFTLLSLAAVTVLLVSSSVSRSVAAAWQSRRVMRLWMRTATPIVLDGLTVQRCDMASPAVAVLGFLNVRIFASSKIFDALDGDELCAALRHEAVHVHRFDVLKKFFFQLTPTFFPGLDLLKGVNDHWSRVSELAADEESVAGDAPQTLHLASALVKVARLANPGSELPTLSAALHGRETFLSHRVRRLLEISEHPGAIADGVVLDMRKLLLAGVCVTAIILAAYPQVLTVTHELLEFLVRG
jgi:Zn-dependent protease with chaperone function